MEIRIPFPLSDETRPHYEAAVKAVRELEKQGAKVVGVDLIEPQPGNHAGVIVLDKPLGGP